MSYVTPTVLPFDTGNYKVTVPAALSVGGKNYNFSTWEDGSINPQRMITLNKNISATAIYVEVIQTVNVTVFGIAGPITVGPRSVVAVITKPDNSKDTLPTVQTDAQGNYTTMKQYAFGVYSVTVTVIEDAENFAASATKTFNVPKNASAITVDVKVE